VLLPGGRIVKTVLALAACLFAAGCAANGAAPSPPNSYSRALVPSQRSYDVLPDLADPISAAPGGAMVCHLSTRPGACRSSAALRPDRLISA